MIILHHYEMSPFSEKIRLMLGYSGLSWQSLVSPAMPPRPNLDPLTGGYRRIPVAQVGADLFCDTRLISEEIAVMTSRPELSTLRADEELNAYLADLESSVFWASVLSIPPGVTLKKLVQNLGPWQALRFIRDRAGVGRSARMDTPSPKQARQQFRRHLDEMEQRLQADFLFAAAPCIADFCAYHTLWFTHIVGELPLPPDLPRVQAWFQRMTACGHAQRDEITQTHAIAAARENSPRPVEAAFALDPRIGNRVSVSPTDYALDAVNGILVGCSPTRYIVARETDSFGDIHVHFPRTGFQVSAGDD